MCGVCDVVFGCEEFVEAGAEAGAWRALGKIEVSEEITEGLIGVLAGIEEC